MDTTDDGADLAPLSASARNDVFWVTRRLAVGPHPTPLMAKALAACGITHVLDVGDGSPASYDAAALFVEAVWVRMDDLVLIPRERARTCLDAIHHMLVHRRGSPLE